MRNIADGYGPVFNAGERVEESTSPLWVWMLWLGDAVLPLRLEWIAVLSGIFLSLGGPAASCLGAMKLHGRRDDAALWAPIGALILLAIAPMWKFSSGGIASLAGRHDTIPRSRDTASAWRVMQSVPRPTSSTSSGWAMH